jgi:hypothetical protein
VALLVPSGTIWFEPDEDQSIHNSWGNRILTGGAISAQGAPNMTVVISAGTLQYQGAKVTIAAVASLTIAANGTSNPRIDTVHVPGATGAAAVVTGTAAATPAPPALPAGSLLLGYVSVAAAAVNIANANISDRRLLQQTGGTLIGAELANYLSITGAAASSAVAITALGSDTDISINLVPKGAGTVSLGPTASVVGSIPTNYHRFRYEPFGTTPGAIAITNVGTGTTTAYGQGRGLQLNTGATNPSSTGIRVHASTSSTDNLTISKIRQIEFQFALANNFANANCYLYFTDQQVDVAPSGTARHFGIKNLNGTISFTTGDGTTEQTTNVTAFVPAAQISNVAITFDGTTARCYIDGVLRATHATNIPAGGSGTPVLRAFIDNNSSVNDRTMGFYVAEAIILNA